MDFNAALTLVREYATPLLGKQCTTTLFERFDVSDTSCLTLLLSKLIGLGVVVGSSIVKLPQIIKIVGAGSAEGLSLVAYLLETFGYCVSLSYNYRSGNPFSTYGESFFTFTQDLIILVLLLYYTQRYAGMVLAAIVYLGIAGTLVLRDDIVPFPALKILYSFNLPLLAASRLPQIYSNYANGHTGQLSAVTIFLYFAGALARVGTTLKEVNDQLILTGFLVSTLLNGILAAQILFYWKATDERKKAAAVAASKKNK